MTDVNLKDYFDGVFVLNLDRSKEKFEAFEERAKAAGVTGYERVRAVDGDICNPSYWFHKSIAGYNGAWGCLLSHHRVCIDAQLDGLKNYLVFEDDACFSENFAEELPKIMANIDSLDGEWDLLYLGGQHLYKETSPPWYFRDNLVRCNNVNRCHAMVVNGRFMNHFAKHVLYAPDYLDRAKEGFNMHIDHQLGMIHRDFITLAAQPWLCGQAANMSSINGKQQPEQWWHDNGWGK